MNIFKGNVWADLEANKEFIIVAPKDCAVFETEKDESTQLITVVEKLDKKTKDGSKILIVIRTDSEYPQAFGLARQPWEFRDCRLGGVEHEIYAVLLDIDDNPIFKSKSVHVRLIRS